MLGDRPPRRLGEGRHTIVADLAAFELRRLLDQRLGLFIQAETEAIMTVDTVFRGNSFASHDGLRCDGICTSN